MRMLLSMNAEDVSVYSWEKMKATSLGGRTWPGVHLGWSFAHFVKSSLCYELWHYLFAKLSEKGH
jgi:hypothetical protein